MLFTRVDHIGIVVRTIDEGLALYEGGFGVGGWELFEMPERHMRAAAARVGDTLVELIAPTSEEASFAKYLAERGPGVHHIAYEVPDVAAALGELRAQGMRLIDEEPRPGMHGTLVAFVHPRSAQGVLIELVEHPGGPPRAPRAE